jgi:hypothetical protein
MFGYLVFAIVDFHEFQGFHLLKQVHLKIDQVYTWYLLSGNRKECIIYMNSIIDFYLILKGSCLERILQGFYWK